MKPLPRGRHGLPREFVLENQRRRLLAAVTETLAEAGLEGTTVATVASRAEISKSDFYAHFSSKDDCFLAAYDDAVERLRADVLNGCGGESSWAEAVCVGLAAALASLAAAPPRANLLLVEGLRVGPGIYQRYGAAVASFVPYLHSGAPRPKASASLPEEASEAVVGGVASLLARRVSAGDAGYLERYFPELAQFALRPYVGVAEARRIISSR